MTLLKWFDQRPVLQCIGLSIFLTLVVEFFSRRSIIEGFVFLFSQPLLFMYNVAIILLTLAIAFFLKRRYFGIILASVLWISLSVSNFVMLFFRTTPLAAIDFQIFMSVNSIIKMYLNGFEIALILAVIVCVVAGLVWVWLRTPPRKPRFVAAIATILAVALLIGSLNFYLVKEEVILSTFGNLADAYQDYGFAYCFARSLVDRGVSKPEDFSEDKITVLLRNLRADEAISPEVKPNIIMVQLESYFDVNYLEGLEFSQNPVPIFTELKGNYPHGFLRVPSIGAGTANTEFEILTGMSLAYFGAGEYPYKTVLQNTTCESINFNLAELGYTNHAIHNHQGSFYERHVVFSNLGFDTFTSVEYMNGVEFTPLGWAKDKVLTGEIMKVLASTDEQDFVYAISVQAHGKYPEEVIAEDQQISVTGIEGKEQVAFEYFVNQVYETDIFIGELITALSTFEEPVALVLFGDHLPSLNIDNEDLGHNNRFETEYVIWSNFDLDAENQDLSAYQLSAYVLEQLGISNGLITKLHQTYRHRADYQESLELLEYDLVSGEQVAYNGQNPHVATELQMGTADIAITSVYTGDDKVFVFGENFTEWSQVLVDGKRVDTLYLDQGTLVVATGAIESGTNFEVAQVGNNTVLSKTEIYIYP